MPYEYDGDINMLAAEVDAARRRLHMLTDLVITALDKLDDPEAIRSIKEELSAAQQAVHDQSESGEHDVERLDELSQPGDAQGMREWRAENRAKRAAAAASAPQ